MNQISVSGTWVVAVGIRLQTAITRPGWTSLSHIYLLVSHLRTGSSYPFSHP